MEKVVTVQELEDFKKSVHDLKEMMEKVNKGQTDFNSRIEIMVKEAIQKHPGITDKRIVEFPDSGLSLMSKQAAIFKRMERDNPSLVEESDNVFLLSLITKQHPTKLKCWEAFSYSLGDYKKALDTSTSGGVSEWIPTDFSSQFYELVRLETKVAALFPNLPMPTASYTLPIQIGRIKTYKQAENTGDTGQTKIPVGDTVSISSSVTFTAVKQAARVLVSDESVEDSIVPLLPFLRQELITAMAEGWEDAILNGDTAGSHEDTDITDSDDRRKLFLGLRALSNDNSYKTDLSTFNLSNIRSGRQNMQKYGIFPNRLALIAGINGMMKLLSLSEVVTVDKYGANATILNGEIGKLDGSPIIVSEWIRQNLGSTGLYSASGTKTVMHYVHRNAYALGSYGQVQSKFLDQVYAESGQAALIISQRKAFNTFYPIANNRTVETFYNF